jgi:hypothetical protein
MTVVIGRRFGDAMVILSDTMISDSNTGRDNIIPGRLKAIIVADRLSIAYAGALHTSGHKPDPKFVAAGHVPCGSRRHVHHHTTRSLVRSGFVTRTSLSESRKTNIFRDMRLALSWCLFGEWSYHLSSFLPMR